MATHRQLLSRSSFGYLSRLRHSLPIRGKSCEGVSFCFVERHRSGGSRSLQQTWSSRVAIGVAARSRNGIRHSIALLRASWLPSSSQSPPPNPTHHHFTAQHLSHRHPLQPSPTSRCPQPNDTILRGESRPTAIYTSTNARQLGGDGCDIPSRRHFGGGLWRNRFNFHLFQLHQNEISAESFHSNRLTTS